MSIILLKELHRIYSADGKKASGKLGINGISAFIGKVFWALCITPPAPSASWQASIKGEATYLLQPLRDTTGPPSAGKQAAGRYEVRR